MLGKNKTFYNENKKTLIFLMTNNKKMTNYVCGRSFSVFINQIRYLHQVKTVIANSYVNEMNVFSVDKRWLETQDDKFL